MKERKPLEIIIAGTAFLLVGLLFSKLFSLLYRLVLANWLGPEAYGEFSVAFAVLGVISTIALVGIPNGLERNIAFYLEKVPYVKGLIKSGLKISIPLSIIASVLMFLLSETIAIRIFDNNNLTIILKLFSITLPLYVINDILFSIMRGFKSIKYQTWLRDILEKLIRLILTIILLIFGYKLFGVGLAFLITNFIILILAILVIHYKIFSFTNKEKSKKMFKILFTFSWPLLFVGILSNLRAWIDILMLGYYETETLVGIYNAASPIASTLTIVLGSLLALYIPVFSDLLAKKDDFSMKKIFVTVTRWSFILTYPLFLIFVFFGDNILRILFGVEYEIGYVVLIILSISYFIDMGTGPSGSTLRAIGKTKLILFNSILFVGLSIILNIILIPKMGMEGAAIASVLSILLVNILILLQVYHFLKFQPFNRRYLKPLILATIILALFYLLTKSIIASPPIWLLIILFILYWVIYFLALIALKSFNRDDLVIIDIIEKKYNWNLEKIRKIFRV